MSAESSVFETREQFLERRLRDMFPVLAPLEQRPDFKALAEALAAAQAEGRHHACQLVDSSGSKVPFPEVAVFILKRVAEVLAQGDSISTIPISQELSVKETADALNVDPEYVDRLLDEGSIPYTEKGKHRRMHVKDVVAFKYKWEREREKGLSELVRMTEELGGYEKQSKMYQNEG